MDISFRLKMVAEQLKYGRIIADIGTDHAYVPIYLHRKGLIDRAIACDIKEGPIQRAKENIINNHRQRDIETRLGYGLIPIKPNEVDAVIIAGMGGMLTISILKNSPETVQSLKQLILQPQLDMGKVRKYIHSIDFKIENEEMIIDDGKYYTIISAIPGQEKYNDEKEYVFGKRLIEKKHTVLKKYIVYKMGKQEEIIEKLEHVETKNAGLKRRALEEEYKMFQEVYECL